MLVCVCVCVVCVSVCVCAYVREFMCRSVVAQVSNSTKKQNYCASVTTRTHSRSVFSCASRLLVFLVLFRFLFCNFERCVCVLVCI